MKQKEKKLFIILSILPALILFIIFMCLPTLNIFTLSLFKWGGLSADSKVFVAFNNFKILFTDLNFIRSLQNTIFLIVFVSTFTLSISLIFAAILVREKIKGQNFFRIIFYIPNILSVMVISAIFSAIYEPNKGLFNTFLRLFKGESYLGIQFLGNQKIVIFAIAIALIWQAIGYYMVMYMASMSSISNHLYEAADLEGASKTKQFFLITIPLIWNNIRTTLTFFVISTINLSFLFIFILTNGGPDGASETVLSYLYKQAFTNRSYGYGMAIASIVFIFSFLLSALLNFVTRRDIIEH